MSQRLREERLRCWNDLGEEEYCRKKKKFEEDEVFCTSLENDRDTQERQNFSQQSHKTLETIVPLVALARISLEAYSSLYVTLVKQGTRVQRLSESEQGTFKKGELQEILTVHSLSGWNRSRKDILHRLTNIELHQPFRNTASRSVEISSSCDIKPVKLEVEIVSMDLEALHWSEGFVVDILSCKFDISTNSTNAFWPNSAKREKQNFNPAFESSGVDDWFENSVANEQSLQTNPEVTLMEIEPAITLSQIPSALLGKPYHSQDPQISRQGVSHFESMNSRQKTDAKTTSAHVSVSERNSGQTIELCSEGQQSNFDSQALILEGAAAMVDISRNLPDERECKRLAALSGIGVVVVHSWFKLRKSTLVFLEAAHSMLQHMDCDKGDKISLVARVAGMDLSRVKAWFSARRKGALASTLPLPKQPTPSTNVPPIFEPSCSEVNKGGASESMPDAQESAGIVDPLCPLNPEALAPGTQRDTLLQQLTKATTQFTITGGTPANCETVQLGQKIGCVLDKDFDLVSGRVRTRLKAGVCIGVVTEKIRKVHDETYCVRGCQEIHNFYFVRFRAMAVSKHQSGPNPCIDLMVDLHRRLQALSWDEVLLAEAESHEKLQDLWFYVCGRLEVTREQPSQSQLQKGSGMKCSMAQSQPSALPQVWEIGALVWVKLGQAWWPAKVKQLLTQVGLTAFYDCWCLLQVLEVKSLGDVLSVQTFGCPAALVDVRKERVRSLRETTDVLSHGSIHSAAFKSALDEAMKYAEINGTVIPWMRLKELGGAESRR